MKPRSHVMLTPILLSGILIFAGVVVFVGQSTYNREQQAIEEYTHSKMKSLILDLEVKMVSTESVLSDKSHRVDLTLGDTLTIYRNLKKFVQDNDFIVNTCLEIWDEGVSEELDTASEVYYAGRDETGSIYSGHQTVYDEEVYEDEMIVFNKADETGRPCWSQPYPDRYLSRTYVVTCYKKCDVPGAMLSADVKLTTLLQNIDSMQFYDNSRMYVVSSRGDIFTLENGEIVKTDRMDFDPSRQIKITAHYRNLDIDIINIVPKDEIYSTVWHGILAVFLICVVGLTVIALLVHRSFVAAQKRLAMTLEKSSQEEMVLKRIEDELAIAARIQKQMLTSPDTGVHLVPEAGLAVDIMSKIIPAREVGGDLYEYRMKGHHLVVCVGDVSGKGIPASVVMTKCCTLFHAYVSDTEMPDPADLLRYMNTQLCHRNDAMMFVTMWAGVLDMQSGALAYASAGHNRPVLFGGAGVRFLTTATQGSLPLGLFDDVEYSTSKIQLAINDALLIYTDGVTEAEDACHNLYGDEALLAASGTIGSRCPAIICDTILQSVRSHAKGNVQSDDITMLCLTFGGRHAQLHGIEDVDALHLLTSECGGDYRTALALEELAANAFKHGGATTVGVEAVEASRYIITDNGAAFDPTAYIAPQEHDDELAIGGRGIALVRAICSEFSYQRLNNEYNKTTIKPKEEIPS